MHLGLAWTRRKFPSPCEPGVELRSLQVSRKALLPRVLSVQGVELALRAPFKSPHPQAPARSDVRPALPQGLIAPLSLCAYQLRHTQLFQLRLCSAGTAAQADQAARVCALGLQQGAASVDALAGAGASAGAGGDRGALLRRWRALFMDTLSCHRTAQRLEPCCHISDVCTLLA